MNGSDHRGPARCPEVADAERSAEQADCLWRDTRVRRRRVDAARRRRRCTSSVAVLPVTMHTTFTASTESAPPPWSSVPNPTEHPMYAAAGIVVTEMATPTADPAAVS